MWGERHQKRDEPFHDNKEIKIKEEVIFVKNILYSDVLVKFKGDN